MYKVIYKNTYIIILVVNLFKASMAIIIIFNLNS